MHGSSFSAPSIAIVGMGCVYPDARTPVELWENVLAQRRAFRRLPSERLRVEDYYSTDRSKPDVSYACEAAVIEGYDFDRVGFRVAGSTFRSADLAHWLALDVASGALADAGFAEGRGLPKETTGVLVGNTLTGEFSRASGMRLRWPYVKRVVEAALEREGWERERREAFLQGVESDYKAPFEPVGEETLAGGLSNTIAGRICNHFDLKGGGYTVDGACASSLLAIANGCTGLHNGDLDVAVAGGVDLSLDPFELVGFAKTGALADDEMRVFDKRSAGFWPGEGCGFVVLMRHQDALAQGCRVYAIIRGWGISSDGGGGITRPEAAGQLEAIRRAYRRAGFGVDTVSYCEAHGTGTSVGDATELEVLSRARREANPHAAPAALGSIKANIGHTKAAAGVAGVVKATMAVHTQVLPPTTGCSRPLGLCDGTGSALKVQPEAEIWPNNLPLRASVSAMGFGGINTHVVLESTVSERRTRLSAREGLLSRSYQNAELFLFAADTEARLKEQIEKLQTIANRISRAEMGDLAATLVAELRPGTVRAAVVASTPAELDRRLAALQRSLEETQDNLKGGHQTSSPLRLQDGVFLACGNRTPAIGFLFPGQGTIAHGHGQIWSRRFASVGKIYADAALAQNSDEISTRVMQPAVVAASLAGLKVLDELGVVACGAIGHSLGEITALCWAGVLSEEAVMRIAQVRGAAMAELGSPTGAMLAVAAAAEEVQPLLKDEQAWIVGYNSPRQTVVAGESPAIDDLAQKATRAGLQTARLPVSHAFHTPLVASAAPVLAQQLQHEDFARPIGRLVSSITGRELNEADDIREMLAKQVTSPVLFESGFRNLLQANGQIDLLIEVGPGNVLSGLASELTDVPAIALDASGESLAGLLQAVAAAFVLGAQLRHEKLFAGRFTRPFSLEWTPKFFANPCEKAPLSEQREVTGEKAEVGSERAEVRGQRREVTGEKPKTVPASQIPVSALTSHLSPQTSTTPLTLLKQLVAERAELPVASIQDHSRMLSDLHLNSITVGQLVSDAAQRLSLPRILGLTEFANATVSEIALALETLKQSGPRATTATERPPTGVDNWVENFIVKLVEVKRSAPRQRNGHSSAGAGEWQVFCAREVSLVTELRQRLREVSGKGVLAYLPERPASEHFDLLLRAAHALLTLKEQATFVLLQHGWGGAGFARTLQLETPGLKVCIVNVAPGRTEAVQWILNEIESSSGYTEAHYDGKGKRFEPRLVGLATDRNQSRAQAKIRNSKPKTKNSESFASQSLPIGKQDVILVTGGGKGIAAECALALGRETGAALVLIGRSEPAADQTLAANLERVAAAGVRCCYAQADVTDAAAVRRAIAQAEKKFGTITGFLHGAGLNLPHLIASLDAHSFARTLAPKVDGFRHVLAALKQDRLRLLVTFSSIIARTGLPGEADYATANEWLTALTEEFGKSHPKCRCLALEWSVWSGIGMGDRLGRLESLASHGIMPISPDDGVRKLLEILRHPACPVAVVVAGRFGEPPALRPLKQELPLQRFLERKRVHYPGIELVVDVSLSAETDPYLKDHALQKEPLFPAVLGLEAMAQAAMALTGSATPPSFEDVRFARPIAIGQGRRSSMRVAALRRGPDLIEVVIRSEETDFHIDHFRALCRFNSAQPTRNTQHATRHAPLLPLDPLTDLYGPLLFHEGRFRRVGGYRLLSAKECVAEIIPDGKTSWFGPYLPSNFVLGDPGARDAALHAIQACIPHQRILPAAIQKVTILDTKPGLRFAQARERYRQGNTFVYDFEVTDSRGKIVERWSGLELRAIENLSRKQPWPRSLIGPYLERRLEELVASPCVSVALEHARNGHKSPRSQSEDGSDTTLFLSPASQRPAGSDTAIQRALGKGARVWRRPDGKPMIWEETSISAAHQHALTLAIAGKGQVACDLETVTERPETAWMGLLGAERLTLAGRISQLQSEAVSSAATRLWTALECLRKAGLPPGAPLVLEASAQDGWILLRSGTLLIASCVVPVADMKQPLAFAIALRPDPDSLQPQTVAEIVPPGSRALDAIKSPHPE